jgi:hypothetical protein
MNNVSFYLLNENYSLDVVKEEKRGKNKSMIKLYTILLIFASCFSFVHESFGLSGKGQYNDPKFFLKNRVLSLNFYEAKQRDHFRRSKNSNPIITAHWFYKFGGIAFRYQMNQSHYPILKKSDLKKTEIMTLSPAEKYEIARGDYNFS